MTDFNVNRRLKIMPLFFMFIMMGCSSLKREASPSEKFINSELETFRCLCELSEDKKAGDWAINEIEKRLNLHFYNQEGKAPFSPQLFESEYLILSEYIVARPSEDLLSFYAKFDSGSCLGETQSAAFAKVACKNPDIFFAWKGCEKIADRIFQNVEICFESPKQCLEYADLLKTYSEKQNSHRTDLVRKYEKMLRENAKDWEGKGVKP